MRARALALTATSLALLLVLGACGDDDDGGTVFGGAGAADDAPGDDISDDDIADAIDEALSDGFDGLSSDDIDFGDVNQRCIDALEQYSEAFTSIGSAAGLAEVADAFDALADAFPDIEDELHTMANAARAASEGDTSALLGADVAQAGQRVGQYFTTECLD